MISHNQDASNLSKRYERRAKIAAWTVGLPGLFGGILPEVASVQTGSAATETALNNQAPNPYAFIANVDRQALDTSDQILVSKTVEHVPMSGSTDSSQVYSVATRGSEPNHYNVLVGSLFKDEVNGKKLLPFNLTVLINADSSDPSHIHNCQKIYQYLPSDVTSVRGSIDLWEGTGITSITNRYRVRGVGNNPGQYKTVNYSQHPDVVASEFKKFFKLTGDILEATK